MALEQTLSIIKPDGVKRNLVGEILRRFESKNLRIVTTRMLHLSKREAEGFYDVHRERPFFEELTTFMSSGPVVVSVLEGENAVVFHREIMGATNPAEAAEGTIRKDFAQSIGENTVHGSDSLENAAIEIAYFFAQTELVNSQA
ncbi:MAG: nucleoside-diphosphate kinase [SAR324 cluster bacterium]|jgi:nucleoside-diphosphate kinase|nr:nucleoside-diphosphate kinase [SAR324 cluster bacterium]MEE1577617.1 nucleoside-diphosphate kinase [Deltaproteobacteria bacterium]MDP6247930.1 nucleoside-diphosphate kinase [SAR324 cluster bacterium]MDP6464526.1 nucleoside-diphosphate kinase [SAR324 cluster bacterium]MDP6637663.1 nucleoside-diphosphate kinase [SAR324 cluster bacterium]|tara:strand:- start:5613 stop:6044 length:432 start_codon:yes stop_codon:yes gene_type:complete